MSTDDNTPDTAGPGEGERIAKVLARAGVASRRDAERLILEGRVTVNGTTVSSPAVNVTNKDQLAVDGEEVGAPEATRLWLYHKPAGLVTTEHDEEGRPTVFDSLPDDMPRVMSVGRLDLTSEGLLLLTNDGEVKRRLELPSTGWARRYRVRIHGNPTNEQLQPLREGVTVDGIEYQPMEVVIDRQQGTNAWLFVTLREGKNREIRRVMEHLGFAVNRLIRVSFGPFQLGDLPVGDIEEVRAKILREQLGLSKKPEAVTRRRSHGASAEAISPEDAPEDRPKRDRLETKRPEGANVRRELKPRTSASRKSRPEAEEAPKPRAAKFARKPAVPGAFTRPRTWMRANEEEARAAQEPRAAEGRPREERRPHGEGKPRASGFRSHGERPPREGGEERPRSRSAGFRSHSDERGERPRRSWGEHDRPARAPGDRERPARAEGDRASRRHGDDERRPPRRLEGGSDRPRGPRPAREGGEDRPPRAFKPRREGDDARPPRPHQPRREGGGDRPARYSRKTDGDEVRPARGFKPRREGGNDRSPRGVKPRSADEDRRPTRGFSERSPRGDRPEGRRPPRNGPPRDGGFSGRPPGKPRKG